MQGKYRIAMQCIFKFNTIQMVMAGYVCLKQMIFFLIIYWNQTFYIENLGEFNLSTCSFCQWGEAYIVTVAL